MLVVDDSPSCLKVLHMALEGLDCRMLVARSGERALEVARNERPELVLLDVVMDDMDGFETCECLKSDPATRGSVVIFLSGLAEQESRLRGLECGGVDYITKPFSVEEVRAKVGIHLEMMTLRRELELQNKKLRKAYEAQNRLLGIAAHDLRTPLTAILIAADTLRRRDRLEPEVEEELLDIVESSSRNMKTLINELLTVSNVQSNDMSLRKTEVDLSYLVESRLVLHRLPAETKKISIRTDLSPVPSLSLDVNKVAQVVDNLISNAIKYSWPDTSVRVRTEARNGNVYLSVEDQGVGIDPSVHHKVFHPFPKLDIKPTGGEASHGLGLAIVANIVEAHGGTVSLKSAPEEGSTFTVEFPRSL